MGNSIELQLGKYKSKMSTNVDNKVMLELNNESKLLPLDNIVGVIDEYQEYLSEKDASQKYRIYLTITPYCSNVLFNTFTEMVYKEGSDECTYIGASGDSESAFETDADVQAFKDYLGITTGETLTRYDLIRNTSYSHKDVGGVVYHCGYDIFNNHTLRANEFSVVNKLNNDNPHFNTIEDYLRDKDGNIVQGSTFIIKDGKLQNQNFNSHLYQFDTIDSFDLSINKNLIETDGWIGFNNPASMEVKNYGNIVLNKCMNNNKPCEFIDMYPDRSLYSFIPKYNKYRERYEPNWDMVLCYASGCDYDNPLISKGNVNALEMHVVDDLTSLSEKTTRVLCRTTVKNTFSANSSLHLYIMNEDEIISEFDVNVSGLGTDGYHEFYLYKDVIQDYLGLGFTFRVAKIVNGRQCKYYFRTLTPISQQNEVLNKLAFGENIYSDDVVQLLYNNPINTENVVDNLGRPISELYLTIVKRHKGDDLWYSGLTNDKTIEFNHCFGKVTAGLDLSEKDGDFNVHMIHNVEPHSYLSIYKSPQHLCEESGITADDNEFLGDLVELDIYNFNETVLETLYHRFNTVQREILSDEFKDLKYDAVVQDDYDSVYKNGNNTAYEIKERIYNEKSNGEEFPINIMPEGYYYQAHYPIKVREYDTKVLQGQDTRIAFTVDTGQTNGNYYVLNLADSYSLHLINPIIMYHKVDSHKVIGIVTKINGLEVTVKADLRSEETITDYKLFKEEYDKPSFAYNLDDGSGRFFYRELKPYSQISQDSDIYNSIFTNGVHYFHKNINFYLRRQDPFGIYGLSTFEKLSKLQRLVIDGNGKNINHSIVKEETTSTTC